MHQANESFSDEVGDPELEKVGLRNVLRMPFRG